MIALPPTIRKTRPYRVQITTAQEGPLPPDQWRTVWATDPQNAIAARLRDMPNNTALLARGTLWGWVGLGTAHPNGAPLAVQSYRIDALKEETAQ